MDFSPTLFLLFLIVTFSSADPNPELTSLLDLKSGLDPENLRLRSWAVSGDPCGGSFEGVACNEKGQVANISLQGKGLAGKLLPAVGGLRHLTGLYLHYNSLYGEIPVEIASLSELSDLYLNVNNFSGEIPAEIGNMRNLQGICNTCCVSLSVLGGAFFFPFFFRANSCNWCLSLKTVQ